LIKVVFGVMVLSLMVVLGGSFAWGGEATLLSDTQLDRVYGGDAPDESYDGMIFTNVCGTCSLSIDGTQTANSAILINAVGSTVSAQLNISVNSGSQTNIGFTSGP